MTDRELLEKAIYWFRVIAEDMERITPGNLPHNAATTRGRAIRAYEFLEKHKNAMEQTPNEFAAAYDLVSKCAGTIVCGCKVTDEESMDALALRQICKKYLMGFDKTLGL